MLLWLWARRAAEGLTDRIPARACIQPAALASVFTNSARDPPFLLLLWRAPWIDLDPPFDRGPVASLPVAWLGVRPRGYFCRGHLVGYCCGRLLRTRVGFSSVERGADARRWCTAFPALLQPSPVPGVDAAVAALAILRHAGRGRWRPHTIRAAAQSQWMALAAVGWRLLLLLALRQCPLIWQRQTTGPLLLICLPACTVDADHRFGARATAGQARADRSRLVGRRRVGVLSVRPAARLD